MKNESVRKAQGDHNAAAHGGNRPASALTAELRDALQRLDDAAGDLRAALRRSGGSAQGQLALGATRSSGENWGPFPRRSRR